MAASTRAMTRGHKCDFKKQINEELLDSAVAEVIVKTGKQSEIRRHDAGKNQHEGGYLFH